MIIILLVIGVPGLSCAVYTGYLQLRGNFHTVIDGQLYRSAQPTSDQLTFYVRTYGIKTIINLRGNHPGTAWYDNEVAVTRGLGIVHIDFGMSSSKLISPRTAQQIVELMTTAPKPILIHCQSGADRSGLVAALYMKKIAGLDEQRARGQLSFYYGHVGVPIISSAYAMDRSWRAIEANDEERKLIALEGTAIAH
ncbi:dual specificity protein phosphatase family protein [Rhizobium sp. P40RR-XXII]|nr:dual specificity protein phosphatase family protein [Rhizobium sp. P40RR-XXII]